MFKAVQLPASIADLHTSLPNMDRDAFALEQNYSVTTITIPRHCFMKLSLSRLYRTARETGWVWGRRHVAFGKKFPGEKGSVRWCFSVMQNHFFCRQGCGRSLRTCSSGRRKTL
jgi:hypothetical protein